MAGGYLVNAKAVSRQSGFLGDPPRYRPIVAAAHGPRAHRFRSRYVVDDPIVPRCDGRWREGVIRHAQSELEAAKPRACV